MAYMLMQFQLDSYDEWKQAFDSDPGGRKAVAKGHWIGRSTENPNEVFLSVEYPSTEDAQNVRERLQQSGVLDRYPPKVVAIVETADSDQY
jgi:hypothetical protein